MPDHVERLLHAALERRLELVYSQLRAHLPDGEEAVLGEFPPRLTQFGLQGALYHSGLSFMELNLSDELFAVPNDWSLCRRMMRAGVRMGMIDSVTVDYYPSASGADPARRRTRLIPAAARLQEAEESWWRCAHAQAISSSGSR